MTNINEKNRKISELENKVNQQLYQITYAENETKRFQKEIEVIKGVHKSQIDSTNATIANLKKEIDILNKDKTGRNAELENRINKVNLSYEEVNAINNRLTREVEKPEEGVGEEGQQH